MIPILLLAAGTSSRMGNADKLMQPVSGVPILRVLCLRALGVDATYVTLPSLDHPRASILPKQVQPIIVDQSKGMAHSVKSGISALPAECRGVIILPADMPDITGPDLQVIHDAATQSDAPIVRAQTEDGRAGHPVYFAKSEFHRFDALQGDRGAFRLTTGMEAQTELVTLQGERARLDLDTPEDWADWYAKTGQ